MRERSTKTRVLSLRNKEFRCITPQTPLCENDAKEKLKGRSMPFNSQLRYGRFFFIMAVIQMNNILSSVTYVKILCCPVTTVRL